MLRPAHDAGGDLSAPSFKLGDKAIDLIIERCQALNLFIGHDVSVIKHALDGLASLHEHRDQFAGGFAEEIEYVIVASAGRARFLEGVRHHQDFLIERCCSELFSGDAEIVESLGRGFVFEIAQGLFELEE